MSEQVGTQPDERLRFGEGNGSFPSLRTRLGRVRGHPALILVAIAFGVIMVGLDATLGSLEANRLSAAIRQALGDVAL
jgi:hypothetical protein